MAFSVDQIPDLLSRLVWASGGNTSWRKRCEPHVVTTQDTYPKWRCIAVIRKERKGSPWHSTMMTSRPLGSAGKDLQTAGRTRKAETAERTEPQTRAKDLLTAGRTRKAKTGARTEPRDRFSC